MVVSRIRQGATRRFLVGVVLVTTAAMVTLACGGEGSGVAVAGTSVEGRADRPTIVVTTDLWADVVSNIACDDQTSVEALIGSGDDPHSVDLSLAQRGRLGAASLVVANGLGLEETLDDALEAVEREGVPIVRVAEYVEPIAYSGAFGDHGDHSDHAESSDHRDHEADDHEDHADHEGHDDHEGHGDQLGLDPHVWFDPTRVAEIASVLAATLIDDVGLDDETTNACLTVYLDELEAVDTEIGELAAGVPVDQRNVVTSHDSLGYFADRYGFRVMGTVIPASSGMAETNAAHLERLAVVLEGANVRAVFTEHGHGSDSAEALATRAGEIDVVPLYTGTLGEPGSEADTYLGLMRSNARAIVAAVGQ